ncbi:MAG: hypothetical protein Q9219_003044 [cf. Caloplaca sp. 3 TL-2023]
MSKTPSTPNKFNDDDGNEAMSSTERSLTGSQVVCSSVHEQSPASTYGETTGGDSIPATPQDVGSHDATTPLLDSLRAASLNESLDRDSGSPFPVRAVKNYARAEQLSMIGHNLAARAGASRPDELLSNQKSIPSVQEACPEPNIENRSWRKHEEFCQSSQGDDPFTVSHNQAIRLAATNAGASFRPREDRASLPLSADTAQAMLPPSACVFVANLLQSKSDDQLEHSVSEAFQRFGNVYVKIRRDNKGMPFAFCQYENANDAQRAITMGRGLPIDGRSCRTEVAKVNRSLYLSKITGGRISEDEARQVLARFGEIEKLWYCSPTDKEMFRLPEGVWVMFAFYQDCRDAQVGFRDDPTYRLEQPKMPEDMRARVGGNHNGRIQGPRMTARLSTSPQAMMRRTSDSSSIFVGNLPPGTTEDQVREIFGFYGRIAQIEIIRNASVNAVGVNTFAFIEFHSTAEAEYALSVKFELGGHHLRVERKESAEALVRRDAIFSGGSPRNRFPTGSQNTMAMMFQHGVSVGMANASASQSPTAAASLFTPYSSYPLSGVSPYVTFPSSGRLIENEPSQGLHAHAQAFVPQSMQHGMNSGLGQYQVPTITAAHTAHYLPNSNWAQRTTNYQWPPADSTVPTITREEIP